VVQVLLLILLSISNASQEYIKKINPRVPDYQVAQIYHSVTKYSKDLNLDKELLLAIIRVESTFDITKVSNTKDYGLMQVNIRTIKSFNFNLYRLQYDIDYSIFCGAVYLFLLRSNNPTDKYWWARYHSSTKEHKERYIQRIENIIRNRR